MKREDFTHSQQNHLIATINGELAYLPPALPPGLSIAEFALPLASASNAIGELRGASRRIQNPFMLIGPLLRREALTSSAMEGTITTLGDLVLQEADKESNKSDDTRETYNYINAIQKITSFGTINLSQWLIKEAHSILLGGLSQVRGANKRPGQYKNRQNAVGRHGDNIFTARYVPPPPDQAEHCMDALFAFINRPNIVPETRLIDLALMHYQFEAIHPFDDGNGRIGRMLITLAAMQNKLVELPLLHLSPYLEGRKEEYIEKLFRVSTQGEWTEWIKFFLKAVEESCNQAIIVVDRIIELQTALRAQINSVKKPARLLMIIDGLFTKTWTTASEVQNLCKVSFPTAQSDLRTLVQLGVLRELQSISSKLYIAPAIMSLSDRPNT